MRPARSATGGTAFIIVVAVLVLMIGTIALAMQTSQSSTSSANANSASPTSDAASGTPLPSPFTGSKPAIVTHERCGTAVPDFGSMCSSWTYDAGMPQSFNMTNAVQQPQSNRTAVTVFTDYFVLPVHQGDTATFSMKSTNITSFLGYFAAGANDSTSPSELASTGELLFNQTGNYQTYSGSATAPQTGVYVFIFSVPAPEFNDSITFLLMDSAAYNTGITVKVGSPDIQQVTVTDTFPSGNGGQEGFGWYKIPITVYAPTTTAVNLTSLTLNRGGWLKIVPSYLPAVGPQGANAILYMVGAGPTTNHYNNSLFIGASGADGLTGDAVIPIEGSMNPNVVSGTGPVSLSGGGIPDIVGLLYDPSTASAPSSLPVTVSIEGILEQNGSIVPLPTWLNVSYPSQHFVFGNGSTVATTTTLGPGVTFSGVPQYETDDVTYNSSSSSFAFTLQPYNPYYLVLTVDGSSAPKPDQGLYTVVLDETVAGQHFISYLKVDAVPLTPIGSLNTQVSVENTPIS
ncbi:MAG: hypothetical protein JRN59_05715 [Nitrososphaerota archaeon]|nr:hypothetical protein [Nitrososphaerota archaeon]